MPRRVTKDRGRLKLKARRRLEALVRRRTPAQYWMACRAHIVLLSHRGHGIQQIGAALSLDHQVVRRWLKRYLAERFDGLRDRRKTGRPSRFEPPAFRRSWPPSSRPPPSSALLDSAGRPEPSGIFYRGMLNEGSLRWRQVMGRRGISNLGPRSREKPLAMALPGAPAPATCDDVRRVTLRHP
jgi:hypothetical protein